MVALAPASSRLSLLRALKLDADRWLLTWRDAAGEHRSVYREVHLEAFNRFHVPAHVVWTSKTSYLSLVDDDSAEAFSVCPDAEPLPEDLLDAAVSIAFEKRSTWGRIARAAEVVWC